LLFGPENVFAASPFSQNAPSASGSRVNKDAGSLLRYGLPIENEAVRKLQLQVETAATDIKTKRIRSAIDDFESIRSTIKSKSSAILSSVRPSEQARGKALLSEIEDQISPALAALSENSGQGSVQERSSLDRAYKAQSKSSAKLSELEELMVKDGYKVEIPSEFANLPRLQGRATVEFTVKKQGGEKFDIEGELFDKAVLKLVVDGYNAPITGGNFVDLIQKKFYDGMSIQRSDGFVVQTGDPKPDGSVHGYAPSGSSAVRTIPLEISVKGDKAPMYGSTTESDLRGYAATRLPFQSFGALGMARTEEDFDSASSQFFWLLFDSDLTPAGKNLLDGAYSCFGYTVEGADFLKDIKEGDIITSATVVSGLENLVVPN
jgi:cyclophilin family peptidyl-prolyl cis-trans isomerase